MTRDEWARRPRRSAHWASRSLRTAIFERDECQCVWCGASYPLTLDHARPRALGGSHEPRNLLTSCLYCNAARGALSLRTFASRIRSGPEVEILLRSIRNARRRRVAL